MAVSIEPDLAPVVHVREVSVTVFIAQATPPIFTDTAAEFVLQKNITETSIKYTGIF
jgi:hypothetical protein